MLTYWKIIFAWDEQRSGYNNNLSVVSNQKELEKPES